MASLDREGDDTEGDYDLQGAEGVHHRRRRKQDIDRGEQDDREGSGDGRPDGLERGEGGGRHGRLDDGVVQSLDIEREGAREREGEGEGRHRCRKEPLSDPLWMSRSENGGTGGPSGKNSASKGDRVDNIAKGGRHVRDHVPARENRPKGGIAGRHEDAIDLEHMIGRERKRAFLVVECEQARGQGCGRAVLCHDYCGCGRRRREYQISGD